LNSRVRISVISVICLLFACMTNPVAASQADELAKTSSFADEDLIAHALGGISGEAATNSYEAFLANYEKGYRRFEADLILSSDGVLVARHDWDSYLSDYIQPTLPDDEKEGPIPFRDFKSHKIMGKYKPMGIKELIRLLDMYPDTYLVTDTKETDPNIIRKQFEIIVKTANEINPDVLNRIVPEIYSEDMLQIVRSVYAFPEMMLSVYMEDIPDDEALRILQEYQLTLIAMPENRADAKFLRKLNEQHVHAYVHTINSVEDYQRLKKLGVHGIYSDFLYKQEIELDLIRQAQTAGDKSGFSKRMVQNMIGWMTKIMPTL
jgi:glycerophosphoryl diester phosphodiesterase